MIRLRQEEGKPVLGTNMHCADGHQRTDFMLKYAKGPKVLDLGSGQGGFSLALQRKGYDVTMLDILPVTPPHPDIKFIQGDAYKPLTDTYNTILLMEVIEHLKEPQRVIVNCMNALRRRGVLLITTPHIGDWDYVDDHVWRFDEHDVQELLTGYNHEVFADDIFVYAVVRK